MIKQVLQKIAVPPNTRPTALIRNPTAWRTFGDHKRKNPDATFREKKRKYGDSMGKNPDTISVDKFQEKTTEYGDGIGKNPDTISADTFREKTTENGDGMGKTNQNAFQTETEDITDEKIRKKKKRIEQELELFRTWNDNLPQVIDKPHWQVLLYHCESESKRKQYYEALAKGERTLQYKARKKQRKNEAPEISICQHNSLFFLDGSERFSADVPSEKGPLWRDRVQGVHKSKGAHALQYGTPVILDLDFKMDFIMEKQVGNNIRYCNKINLHNWNPMHMVVTGCKNKNIVKDHLTYFSDDFFIDTFEESCLDLFDKNQLVFLMPYGPPMPFYRRNATYVIQPHDHHEGDAPTAMLKAKEHGIEHYSLPFNRFPRMFRKYYNPKVTVMYRILLDLQIDGDFGHAFQKLKRTQEYF